MAQPVFGDSLVLSVTNSSGTSVPIAGIREVTITPAYETTELYTLDSTFRESVKQYEHNVNVDITYAKFDIGAAQEWLGGEGSTATASQDTTDPTLFQIEAVSTADDGSFERTVSVADVVFPEFPVVDASMGEFEEYDLSGSGREVDSLSDTSAA